MFTALPIIVPIFIALIAFLVIGSIILSIIRAIAGGIRSSSTQPRVIDSTLEQDGFWIVDDSLEPGETVQYQFWANGERRTGQIPFQPDASGRQFIYTGGRPERVVIRAIAAAGAASVILADATPPIIEADDEPSWSSRTFGSSNSSSSSSFPSAY
jgi:hypothetical protein